MIKKIIALPLAFVITAGAFSANVLAQQVAENANVEAAVVSASKGLEIATEADKRGSGYKDSRVSMEMILVNAQGEESQRTLRVITLEGGNGVGDKTLTIFDTPKDQKGTALLTHTHLEKNDDQWLYLPALKRVKRIASKNKSGPFVGSEFSFEDLTPQEVEDYDYEYLGDEVIDGMESFKLKRVPKDKHSGYTYQIAWLDKKEYRALKVESYDRKKSLLKTLSTKDWSLYEGKYWRAQATEMVNHQNGKATRLNFDEFEFGVGIKDAKFTKASLKRAR